MFNTSIRCEIGDPKEVLLDPNSLLDMNAPYNRTTPPAWEIAMKISFYVVAMLVDLIGNSIVILIVILNRKMRTTTNTLIANLAISDLLVACFCMWAHVGNNVSQNWPFGNILCKVNTFFQILAVTSSVLTLMIIAVERFYAVVFPFKRNWSPTITGIVIVASWIVSVCTAFPQLIVRKEEKNRWRDRTDRWCTEVWPEFYVDTECNTKAPGKIYYSIVVGLVMYFLPILVMVFTYSIIASRLLRRKHPGRRPSGGKMSSQDRAKRKVTKMLVMVLFVFIVCWSPHQVILLYENLNPNGKKPDYLKTIRYIALYLAYACSAINPILYAGFNENFRRGFVEAFRCVIMQRRNRIDPDGSITRSRASVRHDHGQSERTHMRQALEAKDMNDFANGLAVPDHTVAETIELSESPQDIEGHNHSDLHGESGNGSAPSAVAVTDPEKENMVPLDRSEVVSSVPNNMITDTKLEKEVLVNNSSSDPSDHGAEVGASFGTFPPANSRVFHKNDSVNLESEDSADRSDITAIATAAVPKPPDKSIVDNPNVIDQLNMDTTIAGTADNLFETPSSKQIINLKYTSSLKNLPENMEASNTTTNNFDIASCLDNTRNNIFLNKNLSSPYADDPGSLESSYSQNMDIKDTSRASKLSKTTDASSGNSSSDANSKSLEKSFPGNPEPSNPSNEGTVNMGIYTQGPDTHLDKSMVTTPNSIGEGAGKSMNPKCLVQSNSGAVAAVAVFPDEESFPQVVYSDSDSDSNEEPVSPLKTINLSDEPAAPMLIRVTESSLYTDNKFPHH